MKRSKYKRPREPENQRKENDMSCDELQICNTSTNSNSIKGGGAGNTLGQALLIRSLVVHLYLSSSSFFLHMPRALERWGKTNKRKQEKKTEKEASSIMHSQKEASDNAHDTPYNMRRCNLPSCVRQLAHLVRDTARGPSWSVLDTTDCCRPTVCSVDGCPVSRQR